MGCISSGDPTDSVEPRLVHRRARAVAGAGDLPAAIALLDTGPGAREGSSDRGWADLTAYRDALAARTEPDRPVPPTPARTQFRDGDFSEAHPAPTTPEGRQRLGSQLTRR